MTPVYLMLAGAYTAAAAVWVNIWHRAREEAESLGDQRGKGSVLRKLVDGA
jgi:hypothetical protein